MTVIQLTGMFIVLTTSIVTESSSSNAKTQLHWQKHYDSAKHDAQSAARPLVVVLENTSNQTEKIDESKLGEKDRQTIEQQKFELVRVDVNTDYGKRVAAAFGATKFPYTAVTDDRSKRIVFRKAGQMSERDWTVALAKSAETKVASNRVTANKVVIRSGLPVQWQVDFEAAYQEMQAQGRPMFLYLTAPGCTYCEIMKRDALSREWIADDINANFIPVQVDGRAQRHLAERFQVGLYPTLVVLHPSGEVLETWSGFQSLEDFEAHLSMAKSKLASRQQHIISQ